MLWEQMEWLTLILFPGPTLVWLAAGGYPWGWPLAVYALAGGGLYLIRWPGLGARWAAAVPPTVWVFALPYLAYWPWMASRGVPFREAYRPFLQGPLLGVLVSCLLAAVLGKVIPPLLSAVLSYALLEGLMRVQRALRARRRYSLTVGPSRMRESPRRE